MRYVRHMKKDYVAYSIIGVVMGLVLGFLVANWTQQGPSQSVAAKRDEAASVNSSNSPQLPAGHPDISGGQAGQAKQLPAGHPDVGASAGGGGEAGSATQPAAASAPTELPSLDPLPASVKEERAEQKYKNVQVLTGVPA